MGKRNETYNVRKSQPSIRTISAQGHVSYGRTCYKKIIHYNTLNMLPK